MMRNIALLLFSLSAMNLWGGEVVSLCDVPWTDAAYFWWFDGQRLPEKDRNLMGHGISIGGVKFEKGIAGHTGFSIVYNLSGMASGFTCQIGIDDENHPKDATGEGAGDVNIVILVDRREVFRRNVAYGGAPLPVSVDLKGAWQIELRGEYGGKGFPKQRPVFATPELEVHSREAFLREASGWQEKVAEQKVGASHYPSAPDWKDIKITKEKYGSKEGAYRIDTGKCALLVVPEQGGMIVEYTVPGGENIVCDNGLKEDVVMDRGRAPDRGGHFNRHQPKNYFLPPDPLLLYGRYTVEFPSEGVVLMSSPDSYYLFLKQRYEIRVRPGSSVVEVLNVQRNIAPFAQPCGIWSITRVRPEIAREVAMPSELGDAPRAFLLVPEEFRGRIQGRKGWDFLQISPSLFEALGKNAIEWQQYPRENELRIGFDGFVFEKKFRIDPADREWMGDFYPAHYYVFHDFIEVECHSPTKTLPPNSEISLPETWSLESDRGSVGPSVEAAER